MWSSFYHAGGWGMFPTTILGFFLVAVGVLFLLRPERRFMPLAAALAMATVGSGVLSCTMGVVNTLYYLQKVPAPERLDVLAVGCAESMHNVVLALMLLVSTSLIVCAGSLRAALGAKVQLAS